MNEPSLIRALCIAPLLLIAAMSARAEPSAIVSASLASPANARIRLWGAPAWREQISGWYELRGNRPAWFEGSQVTRAAASLLAEMRAAESRGLDSSDYRGNELATRVAALPASAADSMILALDAEITIRAARFMADLHGGRVSPREAGHDLAVPHAALDLRATLDALLETRDTRGLIDDYEPGFHHYDLLKRALERYQELALEPGLNTLPALPRRSVKPGERYEGMPQLRHLLRELGDLGADPTVEDPAVLDPAASAALRSFQERHGLASDGALGSRTFAALTTPLTQRVRQIEASLERSRWLPAQLDSPPIIVNIPQFKLFAFYTTQDREAAILQMNVVVGKVFPRNNTPVFAADMRYIVLRPYWDVPPSIARDELLPKIRRDPGWIERNDFELVDGQGDDSPVVAPSPESIAALESGALRIRQRPGDSNSLGLVKFMFPNPYNVYLHGTPAQRLFAEPSRAFSHGCVRVEDPLRLAQFVLRDDPGWSAERLAAALPEASAQRVPLQRPIRVFIFYATAIATESGRVFFLDDIYGHDRKLAALLARRRSG